MKLTSDGTVTGLVQGLANGKRTGSRHNGLPVLHDYRYRGTKTLEAELPFECAGGCGRRLETDRWPECAVCRDNAATTFPEVEKRYGGRPR